MNIKRSYVRACAGLPVVLLLLAILGFLANIKVNMGVMSIGLIAVVVMWVSIDMLTQGINVEERKKSAPAPFFNKAKGAEVADSNDDTVDATQVLPESRLEDFSYDGDVAR